jgi:hypothetical protein
MPLIAVLLLPHKAMAVDQQKSEHGLVNLNT